MDAVEQSPLKQIESTFLNILSEIQKRPLGYPQITLKRPIQGTSTSRRQFTERQVTYRWPGKNRDEAWRFACVGRILCSIYDALQEDVIITKRDIFYREPELFGKQLLVDRYVDDIAYTYRVTRRDLNVTAGAKGLHAGLCQTKQVIEPVQTSFLTIDNCRQSFEIIPDSASQLRECHLDHLHWILVIEKEATFRSLVEKGFHKGSLNGPGLLVTAKGYPDLCTRSFLRAICDKTALSLRHRPPIFGLFDADPDGINIMQIYRQGSHRLPNEMALNVPELKWLGVHVDDVWAQVEDGAVLRLTARDRKKAVAMLQMMERHATDRIDDRCRSELQKMLMQNKKAEMQLFEERRGGLEGWLDQKIQRQMNDTIIP